MRGLRVGLVLLVAGIGLVAGVWWMGSRLAAPVPREIGPPPATLVGGERVAFAGGSGALSGWFAAGKAGRGAIVLSHPVRANRRSMLGRAVFLHEAGYSVLLFDFQAHGESPGERISFGVREALDAVAAVGYLRSRVPGVPVAYLGSSQGGAAALLGPAPLAVDGLILEAVYTTIEDAVANRLEIRFCAPGRWLAPLLVWQLGPRLGVPPGAVAPIRKIGEIRAPLLLIAGERDRRVTLAQSRALFAAAPEPKSLWVVPGASHVDLHRHAPAEYERRVLGFLSALPGW